MSSSQIYLVFSNPVAGKEDEFNRWYDDVHVHDVLAVPGLLSAQRFRLADAEIYAAEGFTPPSHRYLAIYEMEGDVDELMGRISESYAEGRMTMDDSLDIATTAMSFWTALGSKLTS